MKIKKVFTLILIIILIILVSVKGQRFYEERMLKEARKQLMNDYSDALEGKAISNDSHAAMVIGVIKIPSVDLSYTILNKVSEENLDLSISKVTGPELNKVGNLVLAGHNKRNGTFFGKLKKVNINDNIILTDNDGKEKSYTIRKMYRVKDTDLSPLNQKNDATTLTLITCTEKEDERLIVFAE
ncbi:sortase [Metabacillus litoralis]|uniref:sortase n=1 Tax=Metabacillus litoralis TaxID=152268 RepID=UPI001CFC918F|nr:sortase [Metabacillus litoralis]